MKQEAREQRRRQIVNAALATFATRGYDKSTMEDVRVAADVSKGTLYLYYDSKEVLFAAVVEAMFEDLLAYLEQAANESQAATAAGQLEAYLKALNQTFEQDNQRIGLYTDFFVQAWQHNSVRTVLADAYQKYITALTSMIQRGIDAGEFHDLDAEITARIITGALDGMLLQKLLAPAADFKPALRQFVDILMRGLIVT